MTTTQATVRALKSIFSTHGIPDIVVSDKGPQYSSECFQKFAASYSFTHTTSSPMHTQSNGEAEQAVQTAKNILRKNEDPSLGLMAYRSTPLQNGLSPSQLLMGRKLRTTLPTVPSNLDQTVLKAQLDQARLKEEQYRQNAADNFNKRHRTIMLPPLETVWVKDQNRSGSVIVREGNPRSYQIRTDIGTTIRRNRQALIHTGERIAAQGNPALSPPRPAPAIVVNLSPATEPVPTARATPSSSPPRAAKATTRAGRSVRPPKQLDL